MCVLYALHGIILGTSIYKKINVCSGGISVKGRLDKIGFAWERERERRRVGTKEWREERERERERESACARSAPWEVFGGIDS